MSTSLTDHPLETSGPRESDKVLPQPANRVRVNERPGSRSCITLLVLWLALGSYARGASAGQGGSLSTGAANGHVADATGASLAGVVVALSSDGLLRPRSTRTDTEGRYRFPALPPGIYSFVLTHPDFQTAHTAAIRIDVGFTATIDVTMELESLTEHVSVVRSSPSIDRQSTAMATAFSADQLAQLPGARSMAAIFAATPSIQVTAFDVGGHTTALGVSSVAFGISGNNRPMVEGIDTTGVQATGFTFDYGSLDGVLVTTAAHTAEWPKPGVQSQFIAKSGGDRYHGSLYADYEHRAWQSFNIDADQIARGAPQGGGLEPRDANRLWSYHDLNGDIGGFIKTGRAWWYASLRHQDVAARYINFLAGPFRNRTTNYSGKATVQATPRNKIIGYAQVGRSRQPHRLEPSGLTGLTRTSAINQTVESTTNQSGLGWVAKVEWQAIPSDRLTIEARAGQFGSNRQERPNGLAPRVEDVGSSIVRGGNRNFEDRMRRDQFFASANYFVTRFGTHQLKGGVESYRTEQTENWIHGFPGDVLHVVRNGVPQAVYLLHTPSRSRAGVWAHGAYGNDVWRLSDRVTLNLGGRFDRYRLYLPAQEHLAGRFNPRTQTFAPVENIVDWNVFAPRLGFILDPSGDGRTVVKLSYSRYWENPGVATAFNANPNQSLWWQSHAWGDANGSGLWEPGEEGRPLENRGGVAIEQLDPDLQLPFVREARTAVEHELGTVMSIHAGLTWREEDQQYLRQNAARPFDAFTTPVRIPDPGRDGVVGTADDGPPIDGRELRADLVGGEAINIVRNVPNAGTRHWTLDVVGTRRLSRRWSLVAGVAHTWSRNQANNYFGQTVRQNFYPLTPNDLINTSSNGSHAFRMWNAKAYGIYLAPGGVQIAALVRHQSGQPFGRTFSTVLNYGSIRMLAEPIGTRRMDHVTLVDLKVERSFRVSADRLTMFVDLFNVLNTNPEQNISWVSGSFLQPLSIVPPRIARVGARFDW